MTHDDDFSQRFERVTDRHVESAAQFENVNQEDSVYRRYRWPILLGYITGVVIGILWLRVPPFVDRGNVPDSYNLMIGLAIISVLVTFVLGLALQYYKIKAVLYFALAEILGVFVMGLSIVLHAFAGLSTMGGASAVLGVLVWCGFFDKRSRKNLTPKRHKLGQSRESYFPTGTVMLGVLVGAIGIMLVIYTNQNYEKSEEFAPYVAMSGLYMLILAASLIIGLILLAFRRRHVFYFFLSQLGGWPIGGLAMSMLRSGT